MDKKEQVIELWRTCFDDTEAFIHLYFNRVYKEENTLVTEKNGRVVSVLQMIPYTMTYYGNEISVAYISGVCTLPSEQGQGLMRQLLHQAFEVMQKKGIDITALIPAHPWLFDYYSTHGYSDIFDYSTETFVRSQSSESISRISVIPFDEISTEILYAYVNRKMRERAFCIQHTYTDFITILCDLKLSGGQIRIALDKNRQPIGAVFFYLYQDTERKLYVKELVYENTEIKNVLLEEAMQRNNAMQAICEVLPDPRIFHPKGMARIINPDRMISLWLSQNKQSSLSEMELKAMDIQTLTQTLLGYERKLAYMSLMLE